jgi:hypothetical protein
MESSAVGEGVLSQQECCWERIAVGEAPARPNGADTVRFANSFAVSYWQREQPFTNRATTLLAKSLLSQQPYSVVGEDCSLPTACGCCWQRIFIFSNFKFKLFLSLLHYLQAHG